MSSLRDPAPETVNEVIDSLSRRGRRRPVGYRGDFGVWWWTRRRLAIAAGRVRCGTTPTPKMYGPG